MIHSCFFLTGDTCDIARALLGKYLFTRINGKEQGGKIMEVEAYKGPDDRASHAYNNRYTPRTEVMFRRGGICYVYLCYGVHYLLNIVTQEEGIPHGVLIRSVAPVVGPGRVTKALGVDHSFNGLPLDGKKIWIEDRGDKVDTIFSTPRIGVDYAGVDALLPWRFHL